MLFRGANRRAPYDQRQQDPTRPRQRWIRRTGWTRPSGTWTAARSTCASCSTPRRHRRVDRAPGMPNSLLAGSYTIVGATTPIPHDASNYTSVGIATSNTNPTTGTGGTVDELLIDRSRSECPGAHSPLEARWRRHRLGRLGGRHRAGRRGLCHGPVRSSREPGWGG